MAMGEIMIFEAEWKKFLESELPRKFDKYDSYNDTRDGPGNLLTKAVEAIRNGNADRFLQALDDQTMDWWGDQVYGSFSERMPEFIKYLKSEYEWDTQQEEEAELEEVETDEDHEYRLILEDMLLERMNDNWWILLCETPLFVYNINKMHSLGWVEGENADISYELNQNPELKKFYKESGLNKDMFSELVCNGMDYDVQGIIGGIVDAGDILKAMVEGDTTFQVDQTIVALHNGLVGSGYFVQPTGSIKLNLKEKMDVDFGSYSLGDVYGTNTWAWRAR